MRRFDQSPVILPVARYVLPLLSLIAAVVSAAATAQSTPEDAAALEQRAISAFEDGDGEGAIALYRQAGEAAENAADSVRLALIVALLEHDRGRDAAAINTLTEALIDAPEHRLPQDRYDEDFARIYRTARDRAVITRRNRALEYVQRASGDIRAGRHDLARDALEHALMLAPDTPSAIYNLAYLDLRTDREQDALAGFERLVAQGTRPGGQEVSSVLRALALTNLGYLYSHRGQHQEAADALDEALGLDPESADAWLNLGLARQALGEKLLARAAFERAYSLRPEDPANVRYVAEIRLEAGKTNEALALLERGVMRHPSSAALHYALGRAREIAGGDADGAFATALGVDSDNGQGFGAIAALRLARRACDAGDSETCARLGEQALALRPRWVDALVVIGEARRVLGDLAGAQDALENAVSIDPTRADVHNNLGDVYCRSRDAARAEQSFMRALEIQPDLAAAQSNLEAVRRAGCDR